MLYFRTIAGICLVVGSLGLASCGGDDPGSTTENAQQATKSQEIEKYNHYVSAANANSSRSFAEQLKFYEKYYVPALESQEPLKSYGVMSDYDIKRVKENLDKALAIPNPMPKIDPVAKDYAQALARLAPLNRELRSYADAKTYLSDQGAKAREKGPAFLAALRDVVKVEEPFNAAVEEQDQINVKAAFDEAKPDTIAYFQAGMIYHSKLAMAAAQDFFSDPDDTEARAAFKASLDEVNKMLEDYEAKLPDACRSTKSSVKSFLATGRTVLNDAEKGRYKERETNSPGSTKSPLEQASEDFSQRFNNMISTFNQRYSC